MEPWTLTPLHCAVGSNGPDKNSGRSDDLDGEEKTINGEEGIVGLRMNLVLAGRTGNAYSNSVRDPRSDRERYSRQAPIDLHSLSQNNQTLSKRDAERTNRMATTVGAGKKVSVRVGI